MRAYSASNEEALRTRDLLKDWAGEGLLTAEQYQRMEQETVCEFRPTNIFLRIVLFIFMVIIVGAAVGLFFVLYAIHSDQAAGFLMMIFGVLSYVTAEIAVSGMKLYRHGSEEALLACSVGFLCAGMQMGRMGVTVPAAGAILSLWIWHRFGLPYASLAAMVFVVWLPGYWTSSPSAQHLIIGTIYAAGLAAVAVVRPHHRFTYLNDRFSLTEAFLWLGIYLAINLQISSVDLLEQWLSRRPATSEFPTSFYWTTWMLTWCLPPVVLARGLRLKDRFVIIVGILAAILTLVTNKPYLGWERHTWDPMLLGALLIGVALLVRRWLGKGPDGIRHGFTAQRLSGKDKTWMSAGATTLGVLAPYILPPSPQTGTPEVRFGGGESGGGGASSDF